MHTSEEDWDCTMDRKSTDVMSRSGARSNRRGGMVKKARLSTEKCCSNLAHMIESIRDQAKLSIWLQLGIAKMIVQGW